MVMFSNGFQNLIFLFTVVNFCFLNMSGRGLKESQIQKMLESNHESSYFSDI